MRWSALALGLLACGGDDAAPEPCEVTWHNYAEGFFLGYCQTCHASTAPDRHGAPPSVVFDDEATTLIHTDALMRAVLSAQPTMPPGGGIADDELALVMEYLECAGGR